MALASMPQSSPGLRAGSQGGRPPTSLESHTAWSEAAAWRSVRAGSFRLRIGRRARRDLRQPGERQFAFSEEMKPKSLQPFRTTGKKPFFNPFSCHGVRFGAPAGGVLAVP